MQQRVDYFLNVPNDILELIFKLIGDEDLYFFACTGRSIFLIAIHNIFWEHRVTNQLPDEIKKIAINELSLEQRFFKTRVIERLYPNLNVHQIQCFNAARANNLVILQSLQHYLSLTLCNNLKDNCGRTFATVARRYGDPEMWQFVFETVCEKNKSSYDCFSNRDELVQLAIQLDQGEGNFEQLLLQGRNYSSYRDEESIEDAIKIQSYHSIKIMLSFCYTKCFDKGDSNADSLSRLCNMTAQYGSAQIMQLLIDHGAYVDMPGAHGGFTPLATAAQHGKLDVIKCLLENGAHINFGTVSPLYNAMAYGRTAIVKFLLAQGATVNLEPILEFQYNHLDCYKFMKKSVLYVGASNNQLSAMTALFEYCDQHHISLNVNDLDKKSGTPLFAAAEQGYAEMSLLLLQKGAAIERRYKGRTPLYVAAEKGHLAVVKVLCQYQAALDHIGPDSDFALSVAVKKGHADVVEFLCKEPRSNIDAVSLSHAKLLLEACREKHKKVVKVLLQYPFNVNFADKYGDTALHDAARLGLEEIMDMLIQHQANVNVQDSRGRTPLHYVVESRPSQSSLNDEKICRMMAHLINAGADPLAKYNDKNILDMVPPYFKNTIAYLQVAMANAERVDTNTAWESTYKM